MEPHKDLPPEVEEMRPDLSAGAREYFRAALAFTLRFYSEEMGAIESTRFDEVDPGEFFREYVWVVHATGFSAAAVGRLMPRLMRAYGHWSILGGESFDEAYGRVAEVCRNEKKARAVHSTAELILEASRPCRPGWWTDFKEDRLSSPELLQDLPFIGPVTRYHLARNIGLLEFVKPDLHLVRMAKHWGYPDCVTMCEDVRPDGMPLGIVDLVLWYAAATFGTLEIRREGGR